MGYSHSYTLNDFNEKDQEALQHVLPVVEDIVRRHSDLLCLDEEQPGTTPIVTAEIIQFNGKGEEGHEPFVFEPRKGQFWTKTARKPYDQAVCEVLLVLNAYLPNLSIDSDGFSCELNNDGILPHLDGCWEEAVKSVKQYGIVYEPILVNRRDPYCDMELKLIDNTFIAPKSSTPDSDVGEESANITTAAVKPQEHVFCGICGHKDVHLYAHIREAHKLTPREYTSQ